MYFVPCGRGNLHDLTMGGSGANVKIVPVVAPDREPTRVTVITSHNTVEIGGWTFKRDDLLFALGVKEERTHGR